MGDRSVSVPKDSLDKASLQLETARGVCDLLYTAACGNALEGLDETTIASVMHDVMERIDKARGLLDAAYPALAVAS